MTDEHTRTPDDDREVAGADDASVDGGDDQAETPPAADPPQAPEDAPADADDVAGASAEAADAGETSPEAAEPTTSASADAEDLGDDAPAATEDTAGDDAPAGAEGSADGAGPGTASAEAEDGASPDEPGATLATEDGRAEDPPAAGDEPAEVGATLATDGDEPDDEPGPTDDLGPTLATTTSASTPSTDDATTPAAADETTTQDPAGSGSSDAGPVATGILAAAGKAQKGVDRKRRTFVGTAVLALVVVGAVLAVVAVLQNRANQEAMRQAQIEAAEAELATAVVDEAEAFELPVRAIDGDAERLRRALEDHLLVSARSDDEVAEETATAVQRLLDDAATLETLGRSDLPEPDPLVDAEAATAVLTELGQLRAEAAAMVEEVEAATTAALAWSDAVLAVNRATAAHAAEVESEQSTSDPDELVALWEAERPGLEAISTTATAAADVPGLAAWAEAHVAYAQAATSWIDGAVANLEAGEIEAYNDAFEATFGTDDPFGFASAVEAATEEALAGPVLADVATLRSRAEVIAEAVTTVERQVVVRFGDAEPATESSPSPGDG